MNGTTVKPPLTHWGIASRAAFTGLMASLILTLAACSSPPVQVHTLIPRAEAADSVQGTQPIKVARVTVPPQVDRTELVIREDNSRLVILEQDWWGAPLADEIRSALVARFSHGGLSGRPAEASIRVTRFDASPGASVWLEASVSLARLGGDRGDPYTCRFRFQQSAGDTVTALVLAHQANLQALTESIIVMARRLAADNPGCPEPP